MNNTHKLLLTAAVAAAFSLAPQIKADDSLLSPRAQALKPSIRSETSKADANLVQNESTGNARAEALRPRVASGTSANDPDLIHVSGYTGRNPFRQSAPQFEVAPLGKSSGKTCEAGCQKPCCAKK